MRLRGRCGSAAWDGDTTADDHDPPYGVAYDPLWREQAGLGTQRQTGRVQNDDCVDWTSAYRLFPGDVVTSGMPVCACRRGGHWHLAAGFTIRSQIIWAKQHFALSRGHYHWQHEPCWYAVRQDRSAHWCADRTQSTLWQLANLNPFGGASEEPITGHGTQKPVELMRRPMVNHTVQGDPFTTHSGIGYYVAAAEVTSRRCSVWTSTQVRGRRGLRWQALSGKPRFGGLRAIRSRL